MLCSHVCILKVPLLTSDDVPEELGMLPANVLFARDNAHREKAGQALVDDLCAHAKHARENVRITGAVLLVEDHTILPAQQALEWSDDHDIDTIFVGLACSLLFVLFVVMSIRISLGLGPHCRQPRSWEPAPHIFGLFRQRRGASLAACCLFALSFLHPNLLQIRM